MSHECFADEIAIEDRGDNADATAAASPFSSEPATDVRPWPRAVLPQYNGNGALAADYATAPSYYPFSPREPVQQRDTAPAREGVDASTQPAPQP